MYLLRTYFIGSVSEWASFFNIVSLVIYTLFSLVFQFLDPIGQKKLCKDSYYVIKADLRVCVYIYTHKWRQSEKFIGWPRYSQRMWLNEVYFFNIVTLVAYALLPLVLQRLNSIGQKSYYQWIWCRQVIFLAHPCIIKTKIMTLFGIFEWSTLKIQIKRFNRLLDIEPSTLLFPNYGIIVWIVIALKIFISPDLTIDLNTTHSDNEKCMCWKFEYNADLISFFFFFFFFHKAYYFISVQLGKK